MEMRSGRDIEEKEVLQTKTSFRKVKGIVHSILEPNHHAMYIVVKEVKLKLWPVKIEGLTMSSSQLLRPCFEPQKPHLRSINLWRRHLQLN